MAGKNGWGLRSVNTGIRRRRYGPDRGSLKRKVPEASKTQGILFLRQESLKLEKTEKSSKRD